MTQDNGGMGGESSSRPMEMPAVKTTIVGGRPPGCGKMLGAIPRGIEILVKKASVDPAFRAIFMDRRAKAADEIGLALDPAEAAMIDSIPEAQLKAIIDKTKVDPAHRQTFLGKYGIVMLAAVGAAAVVASIPLPSLGNRPELLSHGARPDRPPTTSSAPAQPGTQPANDQHSDTLLKDVP